jgi:hypothetical protein
MWHEDMDLDFKHFHPVMFLKTEPLNDIILCIVDKKNALFL